MFRFFLLLLLASVEVSWAFHTPDYVPTCLGPMSDPNGPTCFSPGANPPTKTFYLEFTYITPSGYPKPVIAVNGQIPGPTLTMNQYDKVTFVVTNNLGSPTSLHFHGARQYQTPNNDGVPSMTQCPIANGTTMTYTWCTDRSGTYWYHGHYTEDYPDGLFGAMIVYPYAQANRSVAGDAYAPQYQYDVPVILSDFYFSPTETLMAWFLTPQSFGAEPVPDTYSVNGRFSQQLAYAFPRSSQIRLRFISACALSQFTISIDGLTMTIIEVDGVDVYPYEVNSFPLSVAQRVSVLVNLSSTDAWVSQQSGIYIRFVADTEMYDLDLVQSTLTSVSFTHLVPIYMCDSKNTATACKSLASTGLQAQPGYLPASAYPSGGYRAPLYTLPYTTAVFATAPNTISDLTLIDVAPLYPAYQKSNSAACSVVYTSDPLAPTYLLSLVLSFDDDIYQVNRGYWNGQTMNLDNNYLNLYAAPLGTPLPLLHQSVWQSPSYNATLTNPSINYNTYAINGSVATNDLQLLSSVTGSSPLDDNEGPYNIINGNVNNQYNLPGNVTIEMLLINTDGNPHPIHLHGYAVWIVSTSDIPTAEQTNYPNYPMRDVITLPGSGWAKVRFVTDNPGVWLLHCHISWHLDVGLAVALIDNLPALQSDPTFAYDNLIPADHRQQCVNWNPTFVAAVATPCTTYVENEFAYTTTAASQAPWIMISDTIIVTEALIGLVLYKLNVLNFMLPELIGMNVGTLVGAVFIELIKETYEGVYVLLTLNYVNVTVIMCFGFLFPLSVEKIIKRGRTNKFKMLTGGGNAPAGGAASPASTDDDDSDEDSPKKEKATPPSSGAATAIASPTASTPTAGSIQLNGNLLPPLIRSSSNVDTQPETVVTIPSSSGLVSTTSTAAPSVSNGALALPANALHGPKPSESAVVFHLGATVELTRTGTFNTVTAATPASTNDTIAPATATNSPSQMTTTLSSDVKATSLTRSDEGAKKNSAEPQTAVKKHPGRRGKSRKSLDGSDMGKLAQLLQQSTVNWNLIFIILIGEMIDNFVDGGTIAAAYLTSTSTGLATTIGVFMEELPHLTGSFAVFVAAGAPLWKCVVINMFSSCAFLLGSAFILAIDAAPGVDPNHIKYLLPFAVGSYMYVALVDLTPVLTTMEWTGYKRAIITLGSVCFGIGIQAAVNVYDWKQGTS